MSVYIIIIIIIGMKEILFINFINVIVVNIVCNIVINNGKLKLKVIFNNNFLSIFVCVKFMCFNILKLFSLFLVLFICLI